MLTAEAAAQVTSYKVELTLTQHEKILLLVALRDKVDERLKTASIFKPSDSAKPYFEDAGRLQAIANAISLTTAD